MDLIPLVSGCGIGDIPTKGLYNTNKKGKEIIFYQKNRGRIKYDKFDLGIIAQI